MSASAPGSFRTPHLPHARVGDAMHPGVVTCRAETSLRDVARILATRHVHCVVVRDVRESSEAWRVLSDLDLVAAAAGPGFEERTAGGCAATEVVAISAEEPLDAAARLMTEHRTSHLVAIDPASREPLGIVSTLDVAGVLAWGEA